MEEKKSILSKITNNWLLKLFSLTAAFLMWLLVMIMEDPEDQKTFYNIPVKLVNTEVLEDEGMVYEVLDKTDVVRSVTVTATKSVRDDLNSGDIVAEADFSNLTVTNTVEIRFYSLRYNDKIVDIYGSTEIVKLNIEKKKNKRLSLEVRTTGEAADGYIINNVSANQNRIEISGPESVIASVASAVVTVDVADSTGNISTYANVVLYDAEGKMLEADNISMNAKSVLVSVEILATKSVPVTCSVMGVPAAGYLFTGQVSSNPESVLIAGDPEVLESVNEIVVPESVLNITGQTENLVTNISLTDYLPEGIILADPSFRGKVTLTAYVEKEVPKNFDIPANHIHIVDMPEGFSAALEGDQSYVLGVSGLADDVNALNPEVLIGYVRVGAYMEEHNLTTLHPGTYEMEAQFSIVGNIIVSRPLTVRIVVTEN